MSFDVNSVVLAAAVRVVTVQLSENNDALLGAPVLPSVHACLIQMKRLDLISSDRNSM